MARLWWQKPSRRSTLRQRLHVEELEERLVPANWSGDLPAGVTTWSNAEVHRLTGTVRVPAGSTLVIEPNTVVKANTFAGISLIVDGTLTAQGTSAQPIIFTSDLDDVREDTNGDGGNSSPSNGTWNALQFNAGSTSNVLDHVEVRYGGGAGAAVLVNGGPLTLSNSLLRNSGSAGLRIQTSNPTVSNVEFRHNNVAATMDLASNPAISGVTMTTNGFNALRLDGGSLVGNGFWNDPDIVYLLSGSVTVPQGQTLTVGAGQVVKVGEFSGFGLTVNGTLIADGTSAARIVFTTAREDVGGDLRNDGQAALGRGEWDGLRFTSTSTNNLLDNVEVRYAGNAAGAIWVQGAPLTLTSSSLVASQNAGLRIETANPTVTGITLQNNRLAASMDLGSNPAISGVTMLGNDLNALVLDSGNLVGNRAWDDPDITYLLSGSVTVPQGQTLTVGAGQIVKATEFSSVGLTVHGSLVADGSAAARIVFTTRRDDVGGDVNNNGQPALARGDWEGLRFTSTSTNNLLDNVEVRNAGNAAGAVWVQGAPLTLTNSTILSSQNAGLRIETANPTVTGVTFQNNRLAASMDLASDPAISGVTMLGNDLNALVLDGGNLVGNGLWNDPDITYVLGSSVTVPQGQTLTVGAGQIVKATEFSSVGLTVNGTLVADGSSAARIVFTTRRDDVGGDATNNGQPALGRGEWEGLRFTSTSTNNLLDNVEVRHAGNATGAVWVQGAPLTFTNSRLFSSQNAGLRIESATPTVTGITFQNNRLAASMNLASSPTVSGVTMLGNDVNALVLDSGDLVGNRAWDDTDITYLVTGTVTVPAGQTLTVGAGQIVKFGEFSGAGLTVNGTLLAQGTTNAPIVFTTGRNDAVGGDLRNDGQPALGRGEWNGIQFSSSSTANLLDRVEVSHAGVGLSITGAPLTLRNSVVRESSSHAIQVRSGATVQLQSNLIHHNSDTGIRAESGATVTAINNTLDANLRGVAVSAATLTLTNNLITNHSHSGVFRDGVGTVTASFNDVFNPGAGAGNYEGLSDQTGSNGNRAVNPQYFNQASAQYQLRAGSPAIDAATSDSAPTTDFLGNARFDDPNVLGVNGGGALPFFDRGALERQEISTSNIDLATTSVGGPATALAEQSVTVNWTIQNVGTALAAGPWTDAVYLSVDPVWTPDDLFLGELAHSGDLGQGGRYSASTTVPLPAALPGDYYFIVRADSRSDVFEGLNRANNAGASVDTISLDLPALTFGTPLNGQLAASGTSKLYKLAAPAGADIKVELTGAAGASNELYVRFGDVATRQLFDQRDNRPGLVNQAVSVANSQEGNYYVLVHAADLPSAETFTLKATLTGFSISGVSPTQGSNTGRVTLTITGARFDANSHPQLIDRAGAVVEPVQVHFLDSGRLSATFDLTGRAVGLADVRVVNSGNATVTLPQCVNVQPGQSGHLSTSLIAPARVRLGRDFIAYVEYRNDGQTDLVAPIFRVYSSGFADLSLTPDRHETSTSLSLIAVNPDGAAGILPPGGSGRIAIYGRAVANGDETLNVEIAEFPTTPIDYVAIESAVRPADISDADWDPLYQQLQTQLGTTWAGYLAALSRDATLLPPGEEPNYSVGAVFQVEVNKARAALSTAVSGRVFRADLAHPLGGATVRLQGRNTGLVFKGQALNDGSFLAYGVQPDTYDVSVDDFLLASPVSVTVNGGSVGGVNLVVAPAGSVSGGVLVTVGGVPLKNVTVFAIDANNNVFASSTDDDGTYRIDNLPPGTYELRAGDGQFVERVVGNVQVGAGEQVQHVNLGLDVAAAVSGRVLGPGGTSLEGAIVVAYNDAGQRVGGATTSATGDYRLEGVPPGIYRLQATFAGFALGVLPSVVTTAGATTTGQNFTLALGGALQGIITSQLNGAAIPFPIVVATRAGATVQSTQANNDGTFEFSDLAPGTYEISAGLTGFVLGAVNATVVAGQTSTVPALALASAGRIEGRLTRQSNGAALAGVRVTLFANGEPVNDATTDANGNYTITDLAYGTYLVAVGFPGSAGAASNTATVSSGAPTATVDFALPVIGSISGTVVASDGTTPVADVPVALYAGSDHLARIFSDDNGKFVYLLTSPGTYRLLAAGFGTIYGSSSGLTITSGTDLTGVQLRAGTAQVSGTVSDSVSGQPLANAILHISGTGIDGNTDIVTDAAGHYQFSGPAGAQLSLVADAVGHAYVIQNVTLSASATVTANFSLSAGITFQGRVRAGDTSAVLASATVSIRNQAGPVEGFTAITDSMGKFLVDTLPAGTYDVTVAKIGRQTVVLRGLVLSGTQVVRDFSLDNSSISVSGRVSDASGRGLPAAVIEAIDASGNIVAATFAGNDGNYTLTELPAGSFTLTATTDGAVPVSLAPLTVAAGNVLTGANFSMNIVAVDPEMSGSDLFPGYLSITRRIPPPQRNPGEVKPDDIPPLPAKTCPQVIQSYRILQDYLRLRDQYFELWRQNYEVATDLQDNNVAIVRRMTLKLAGDAASIVLDLTGIYRAFKGVVSDPTVGQEAFAALNALFGRFDKYINSVRSQLIDINNAIASGQPLPSLDIFNTFFGFLKQGIDDFVLAFGEASSHLAKLWGKVSPIAGLANDLISIRSDYKSLFDDKGDLDQAVQGVNNASTLNDNSASLYIKLDGYSRSALEDYKTDLQLCKDSDPKVSPDELPPPGGRPGGTSGVTIRGSFDPNDKTGPSGAGAQGFIQPGLLGYKIEFENTPPLATAAAQEVVVTDTLDADLDLATLEFTGFGFGPYNFTVPAGLGEYHTVLDLRPDGVNLLVPVDLTLNRATRVLTARFQSLDPLTGLPPDDFDAGFLPVDNANGDGDGYFTYTIRAKAGLPTGTQITNQASIVFDVNAPILTPTTLNTLDNGTPTSSVGALSERVATSRFLVSWSGSDDANGSGIAFYDIFVSTDNGPFTPFLLGTADASAMFDGAAGHRYAFYSVATDGVGNREVSLGQAQTTTITPPAANHDAYVLTAFKKLTVVAPGVLSNDQSAVAGGVTLTLVGRPTQGKVTLNADGSFVYKPKLTAKGPDSFTYRLRDAEGVDSELATVRLLPSVRFVSAAVSQSEATTTVKVPVKLSIVSTQAVSIAYTVSGGSATNGVDYQLNNGVLTIPAGKSKGKIVFTVTNDRLREGNETIQLTLSNPTNALLGTPATHTYTIRDDDGGTALRSTFANGLDEDVLTAIAISLLMGRE